MADDLVMSISDKKVKDTVPDSDKEQNKIVDKFKEMVASGGTMLSGLSSTIASATNTINSSIAAISADIDDSLKSFSSKVDTGLKTTLGDATNKHGSMVSDVQGKTDSGAVSKKPAFITNVTNGSVDPINTGSGSTDDLLKSFTNGNTSKLASAVGLDSIGNNSSLQSAIKKNSGSLSDMTSGANSLLGTVVGMPKQTISSISSSINDSTKDMMNSIKSSITEFTGTAGIGDTKQLISDMYEIYSTGKNVYDVVSGKNPNAILGIASKFNNSFSEITSIMNLATKVCSAMNGQGIDNYGNNKDLMDILLKRMARQGMYGAIDRLMNCNEAQSYVDDRTYYMLAQELNSRAMYGDVRTASSIQRTIGNSRIRNADSMMYQLAYSMEEDDDLISEYSDMLGRTGVSRNTLTGVRYDSSSGSQYVYSSDRVSTLYNKNPKLTNNLVGGSNNASLVSTLANIFS